MRSRCHLRVPPRKSPGRWTAPAPGVAGHAGGRQLDHDERQGLRAGGGEPPAAAERGRDERPVRHPQRHRRRLADRVGPADRRPHAHRARRRPGRGTGAGRPGRRARAVAGARASPTTPAPGSWPPPSTARSTCCAAASCSSASTRRSAASSRRSRRRRVPDLDAALDDDVGDDLLRLMFIACHPVLSDRGARRAHAAPARRPHHRRDRARLPGARADDRPAHRAGQADAGRGAGAVRGAARRRARRPPRVGARGDLPDLQRGLLPRPPATTGCGPALCEDALRLGPHPGRARARRAGGPRPGRADGDPGVALAGARRADGRADPAARPGSRRAGISC